MVYKLLCVCLLICCMVGCTEQRSDDSSIFPTPLVPEPQPHPTPPPVPPPEPVPVPPPEPEPQPGPEPEPQPEPEPEPPQPNIPVRDLVGPKLLESTIKAGDFDIDAGLESITLTFDETVAKSDIQLLDEKNKNQGWNRFIKGKEVILVRLDAPPLELGHRYSVFGRAIDKFDNERAILIPFVSQAKE